MIMLEQAIRNIEEILKLLVISMNDKGWENASAEFRIGDRGVPALRLQAGERGGGAPFVSHYMHWDWETIEAPSLEDALRLAHAAIQRMEEHPTKAMAAWFLPIDQQSGAPHPLVPAPDGGDGVPSLSVAATSSPEATVIDFPKRAS